MASKKAATKAAPRKAAATKAPATTKRAATKAPAPVEELVPAHVNVPRAEPPPVVGSVTLPNFSREVTMPVIGHSYDDQLVIVVDQAGVSHEVSKVNTSRAERKALAESGG